MFCKSFLPHSNIRENDGAQLPLSSLKKYIPTPFSQSHIGSSIFAVSESRAGVWREAELDAWDDALNQGLVVFRDNGSSEKLGVEAIALSQYAEVSDNEEASDYSSSEQSGSSDYEDDDGLPQGLGFVESTALQKGIQTDTTIFAKWENHTRGIASKMMANMGYCEGMGLGASGQGIVNPIPVKVLPPKQSLDHALQSSKHEGIEGSQEQKKRSRGGKRKRDKKYAEAARAAKEEEEQRPDVFSLINNHLATHAQMIDDGATKKLKSKDGKKVDRRSLIAYEDEVRELRVRVEKLEEMVNRNRKEKAVFEAATRKLMETRKALAEAEAKHASASDDVVSKEKEKRWLRF